MFVSRLCGPSDRAVITLPAANEALYQPLNIIKLDANVLQQLKITAGKIVIYV